MTHRADWAPLLAALLLLPAIAGCLGQPGPGSNASDPVEDDFGLSDGNASDGDGDGADGNGTDDGSDDADDGNDTDDAGDGNGNGTDDGSDDDAGNGNGTGDNGTYAPGWPSKSDAKIRPGVVLSTDAGQCTAAFIMASPENRTLYVATASHCVSGLSIGDPVTVGGQSNAGLVAYCSWGTIENQETCPGGTGPTGDQIRDTNDFALVEVKDGHRGSVHPAMLGFGGPTGMANTQSLSLGDKVLTYGNSGLRPADLANAREGYVRSGGGGKSTDVYFGPPSVFGDSGSPAVTGDGQAVGVLSGVGPDGSNSISNLDFAVTYMENNTNLTAELKTWSQDGSGVLP